MSDSDLEREFYTRWIQLAPDYPEPIREYEFSDDMKSRFDFAWPSDLIAVEIEGGIFTKGRHVRPNGYENDCKKYNAAVELGWRVLRFTGRMIQNDPASCIEQIKRVMRC